MGLWFFFHHYLYVCCSLLHKQHYRCISCRVCSEHRFIACSVRYSNFLELLVIHMCPCSLAGEADACKFLLNNEGKSYNSSCSLQPQFLSMRVAKTAWLYPFLLFPSGWPVSCNVLHSSSFCRAYSVPPSFDKPRLFWSLCLQSLAWLHPPAHDHQYLCKPLLASMVFISRHLKSVWKGRLEL